MKKRAATGAALLTLAAGASAQSNVQLYGIVDVAVRATTNAGPDGGTVKDVRDGMSQSRLGLNVTEDLGDGLRAVVNMEHRFLSDTGTAAAADFWRQAWVGLQSNSLGAIRLGRQYNLLFDIYTSTYASFKYSPYIEAYKPEIGLSMGARQSNMVKYIGEVGPVRGEIQVSAGEGTSNDKSAGALLRWAQGDWAFGGAYLQVTALNGAKVKGSTVGGAWTSGPWYVNLSWAQNKFDAETSLGTSNLQAAYSSGLLGTVFNAALNDVKKRDMVSVGATYQITPSLNVGGHYWRAKQEHYDAARPGDSKGDFVAFVADYAFSKRADAYLEVDHTKAKGYVIFANGQDQRTGMMAGVRHRF